MIIIWNWLFHDYLIMMICNYLTLIIWTYFIIILNFWIIWLILIIWFIWLILIICKEVDYLMIIWNWLFVIIQVWQWLFVIIWFWLFDHYLNYLTYLTYMTYLTYLTYLNYLIYLILFDLESSHYLTGRAAKFLMEKTWKVGNNLSGERKAQDPIKGVSRRFGSSN